MMPLLVGAGAVVFLLLYVLVMGIRPTAYNITVLLVGSFVIGLIVLNWSLVAHLFRM